MRKIIAVGGVPGTGKTSLFRKFLELHTWEKVEPIKLLSALYCKELNLYVFGKYEEGEVFAGTDKLSMACQTNVTEFVKSSTSNIIFEGDRLTNTKFYTMLMELPETELKVIILEANQTTLNQRYKDRGSEQSETFLRGRETKIENILRNFEIREYTESFKNESLEDQTGILECMVQFLYK
jgi:broad-specificity NMP kinase